MFREMAGAARRPSTGSGPRRFDRLTAPSGVEGAEPRGGGLAWLGIAITLLSGALLL